MVPCSTQSPFPYLNRVVQYGRRHNVYVVGDSARVYRNLKRVKNKRAAVFSFLPLVRFYCKYNRFIRLPTLRME